MHDDRRQEVVILPLALLAMSDALAANPEAHVDGFCGSERGPIDDEMGKTAGSHNRCFGFAFFEYGCPHILAV